ncbi:MAG: hypothetical protein AB1792_03155 [Candidatus Zixiibacteriota bacterium]
MEASHTVRTWLRAVGLSTLCLVMCPASLRAQGHLRLDSTFDAGATWPVGAIATALSYVHLLPRDLALRDDYVDRDPFRLPLVDHVMTRPSTAPDVLQQYAARILGTPGTDSAGRPPDAAFLRCRDFLQEFSKRPPFVVGDTLPIPLPSSLAKTIERLSPEWGRFVQRTMRALADTTWPDSIMRRADPATRALLIDSCPQLVRKDEADRERSEEVLDSLQKINDSLATHIRAIAELVDWRWIHSHGAHLLANLIDALPDSAPEGRNFLADTTVILPTPLGPIVFGSRGDDRFTGDPVAIIDPGGDDEYRLVPRPPGHPRLIVDWDGSDTYLAPSGRDLGCGYFSWGLLIDRRGDDTYRAGNFSLGAGWFGVGALIDLSGRDLYEADTYTQGAGGFGLGLLFDAGVEADQYAARLYAQGFGFAAGWGILADAGGNDLYSAGGTYGASLNYRDRFLSLSQGFGYGTRPHFSGGVGLLLDQHGNDVYVGDIFAQGCSYWWAFGGLYDGGGNDRYVAYQYAQGAATHMTAGCLLDAGGDDSYSSKGVSQGCGHDWSAGLLIDAAGNDRYQATDLSQAAGSANGVGVLIDRSGDDVYNVLSRANTQGYGNPRREYGSIGLFLDLGGTDRYDGPGADGTVWLGESMWGVGIDADSTWAGLKPRGRDSR